MHKSFQSEYLLGKFNSIDRILENGNELETDHELRSVTSTMHSNWELVQHWNYARPMHVLQCKIMCLVVTIRYGTISFYSFIRWYEFLLSNLISIHTLALILSLFLRLPLSASLSLPLSLGILFSPLFNRNLSVLISPLPLSQNWLVRYNQIEMVLLAFTITSHSPRGIVNSNECKFNEMNHWLC